MLAYIPFNFMLVFRSSLTIFLGFAVEKVMYGQASATEIFFLQTLLTALVGWMGTKTLACCGTQVFFFASVGRVVSGFSVLTYDL